MVRHNLKCQMQGGRFVTSGVELIRRATPQSFLRCCFSLEFGALFGMLNKCVLRKTHLCVYH